MVISWVYTALQWANLDTVQLLVLVPRILQALLSAYSDYRFYVWSNRSKWSAFMIASAWFWFYTGSRTLSNTLEASLTTIALSYYPWRTGKSRTEPFGFIFLVALLTYIRPTAAIPWLPLCVHHIRASRFTGMELFLKRYLVIG